MSNHLHVVVRTLPEWTEGWTKEEVARRWLRVFPGKRVTSDPMGPPDEVKVRVLCRDLERIAVVRGRLGNLSWFMRCLNEAIARRANSEDECSGRFWEGRFKCQKLDDEGAALSCMAYVDLNPVRAGIAECPEQSEFTSACDRTNAHKARQQLARAPVHPSPEQEQLIARARNEAHRDHWLAPIGPPPVVGGVCSATDSEGDSGILPGQVLTRDHPADPPPLLGQMSEEAYLELLDWTGRQIRDDKSGSISRDLRPVLERIDLDVESWVENVELYGGLFRRMVGKAERLGELAQEAGCAWFHGHAGARRLYSRAA